MDTPFQRATAAIMAGDMHQLCAVLAEDPGLATQHFDCGHPTLLQFLVLEAGGAPNHVEAAQALIEAGAEVDGPLLAAASVDNAEAAAALLDAGASVDGHGGWSPLEEALYWGSRTTIDLLLERGASVRNLRSAAGLGRTELIVRFFHEDGTLKPEAGGIDWPFGDPRASSQPSHVTTQLAASINGWARTPQAVVNNAFIYACMHNRANAARLLLEKGAEINAVPPGFDFAGTGLHYAALNGHREMVDLLLGRGADPSILDPKVNNTPAGWAAYNGHLELAEHLQRVEARFVALHVKPETK